MNWPRKGHGQDPEEVSRGVDAVIVVSAAFSINSNRCPAPEELTQRRYFDRERKRRSHEHRSNPVGRGRIGLSFATLREQIPRSPCLRRQLSEMMDRINKRLRGKIQSPGYGDHSQEICAWSAALLGASRQFQNRGDNVRTGISLSISWAPSGVHWIRA
jgi:hypothetical protein